MTRSAILCIACVLVMSLGGMVMAQQANEAPAVTAPPTPVGPGERAVAPTTPPSGPGMPAGGPPMAAPGGFGAPPSGPMMPPGVSGPMPGGQPGMPGTRGKVPDDVDRAGAFIELVQKMAHMAGNPMFASVIAVGSLKDEIRRKPADVIKDYEDLLETTKSLPIRNAIRLVLKDLYKAQGEDAKFIANLKSMIAENDKAMQENKPPVPEGKTAPK